MYAMVYVVIVVSSTVKPVHLRFGDIAEKGAGTSAVRQCLLQVAEKLYPWNPNKTRTMMTPVDLPTWTGKSQKAPTLAEEIQAIRGCWERKVGLLHSWIPWVIQFQGFCPKHMHIWKTLNGLNWVCVCVCVSKEYGNRMLSCYSGAKKGSSFCERYSLNKEYPSR